MRGSQMTRLPATLRRVVDAGDALGGAVERPPSRRPRSPRRLADRRTQLAGPERAVGVPAATSSPSTRARPRRGRSCSIAPARRSPSAAREFPQVYPEPGHVTHDPEAIWSSQLEAARAAIATAGAAPADIAAIGLTNQRETTIVWDRATGRPVADAIVWQSRITAPYCDELRARGLEPLIRERTGLPLDAYFSGTEDPAHPSLGAGTHGARRARRARLRHRRRVPALAPHRRPGPRDGRLEREPDDALRHPAARLGRRAARGDGDPAGRSCPRSARRPSSTARPTPAIFGASIPIAGVAGDQQAATFGQACFAPGRGQEHVRDRRVPPARHRRPAGRLAERAAHDGRLAARCGRAGRPTRSRARCSWPAPPSSGCATGCG